MRRTHPALIAFAGLVYLFLLGPLVIVLGASVNAATFLAFPPQALSLRWFANAVGTESFRQAFLTSLQVAVCGTTLSLLLGIPAAYAMNRYRIQLPRWLSVFFVMPILIPEIVFGFSLLRVVAVDFSLPIIGALVLGHTLLVLPYSVRVVSASLAAFDFSIEDAAVSLGASRFKAFFTVVLPNIRSAIIAAFTLAFITSLNDVSVSVFLTGPGISTLPIRILAYVEQYFDPTVAAISVIMMAFTAVVMVAVERTLGLASMAR